MQRALTMVIDPHKLLFSLNCDFSPDNCYGFIKKNFFDLFSNKTDWTFSIKCRLGGLSKNYMTLLSLEGIDFGLDVSKDFNLIMRCKDNDELESSASVVPVPGLKELTKEFNTYTITHDASRHCYQLLFNGSLIFERALSGSGQFESNKIKLCCIARQYFSVGNLNQDNQIEISNIMFSELLMSSEQLEDYFSNDPSFCYRDEYDRNVLVENKKVGISAYYNFKDNMFGKVWDLTGNNNFFFTSLSAFERVGSSVL